MSLITSLSGELQTPQCLDTVTCINYSYCYGEVTEDFTEAKTGHHVAELFCIINGVRVCVSFVCSYANVVQEHVPKEHVLDLVVKCHTGHTPLSLYICVQKNAAYVIR